MLSEAASSSFKLAPHRIIPDKEHYIVEHLQTGEFYEMPRPAIEAMEALGLGTSPIEIELSLKVKYPDENIDMKQFLVQLETMGFIMDEIVYPHTESLLGDVDIRNSENSRLTISRFLFHRWSIAVYVVVLCANIAIFIHRPDLIPQPSNLFPFDSMMLNTLAMLGVSIVLLAIHESGHVMAARAFGIQTTVRISHRLFLPVIETQMPTIWRLPRGRRNVPLLAGLFMDHALLFISLTASMFIPSASMGITGLLGLIVLQLILMSIYQCMFFMKTDLYYFIQNVTGSYNLLENAEDWLKEQIPFVRYNNTTVIYDRERNVVRAYAVFYILGLLAISVVFLMYMIPQLVYAVTTSFERLTNATTVVMRIDAIVFFAQFVVYIGLLMYSWRKKFSSAQPH